MTQQTSVDVADRVAAGFDLVALVTTVDARPAPGAAAALGPLLSVKDTIATAGIRTTAGSRRYADHVPTTDAGAVSRLRGAGATLVAKSNTPPLAGDLVCENSLFGRTLNPWDRARTPGGSSGGAAAVAVGAVDLDLCTDSLGSARIPAAWCGTIGFRPSRGRVPADGLLPPNPGLRGGWSLTSMGFSVSDPAVLDWALGVFGATAPPVRSTPWRVGLVAPDGIDGPPIDPVVASAAGSLAVSSIPGVELRPSAFELTLVQRSLGMALRLAAAEASSQLSDDLYALACLAGEGDHDLSPLERTNLAAATMTHRDWLALETERHELADEVAAAVRTWDAIALPMVAVPAPPHPAADRYSRTVDIPGSGEHPFLELVAWSTPATIAGLPSLSMPIGLDPGTGMPVALQLIGPHGSDRSIVAIAAAIAAALPSIAELEDRRQHMIAAERGRQRAAG